MRQLLAICVVLICAACAGAESAVLVTLRAGPRVGGFIDFGAALNLTGGGGTVQISEIAKITLGERIDPNLENEAVVAVGDLQSTNFATREDALAKLRKLGHSAAKPLRQALGSDEAETSRRARELMSELGIAEQAAAELDSVQLTSGKTLKGEAGISEIALRTRWGKLKTQAELVESIEFIRDAAAAQALEKSVAASERKGREFLYMVTDPATLDEHAEAVNPLLELSSDQYEFMAFLNETKDRTLTMDKVPEKKDDTIKWVNTKAGDKLDDAFVVKGVRLRALTKDAVVEVSADQLNNSISGGMSAIAKKSDVEFTFLPPRSKAPANAQDAAEVHGVFFAGCIVYGNSGSVGLAAFDASGRLLGQTFNQRKEPVEQAPPAPNAPPVPQVDRRFEDFLALRSRVPIARLKLFRSAAGKENQTDLRFDDFIFDRPVSCSLRSNECRVETRSGERISGTPRPSDGHSVAMKLPWLGETGEAVTLALDEIKRFEPARVSSLAKKDEKTDEAKKTPEEIKKEKFKRRLHSISPHGVMLQSGEAFRARLMALDEKEALFWLAKGVEIKLPRSAVKIIDLLPDYARENKEEPGPPVGVAANEKPGVLLKRKTGAGQPAAPLPPQEDTSDPKKYTAQGVDRVDDIEVTGVDPNTWMLLFKDDNGNESEIGMTGIRALVFPAAKEADAPQKRAWTLTLREGSRFDINVTRIFTDHIEADMAGGTVKLPADVVESVERK